MQPAIDLAAMVMNFGRLLRAQARQRGQAIEHWQAGVEEGGHRCRPLRFRAAEQLLDGLDEQAKLRSGDRTPCRHQRCRPGRRISE